jgi:protease-4
MDRPSLPGPQELLRLFMGGRPSRTDDGITDRRAIAVIYAVGPIVRGEADDLSIGEYVAAEEDITEAIHAAAERRNVRAIVLRVDSPGGSSVASDIIWRALREANEQKPVIVSLSDVAASGGYYIAAAGRTVFTEPSTITGSIGVVGGKFVLKGMFDKLGLNVEVFERGENSGLLSSVEEFSESERDRLHELMLDTYETFLDRVASSRDMTVQKVREAAGGRPWTGLQAKERGLVDKLGGLSDAVVAAKVAAGIPPEQDVEIVRLPRPRSVIELLFGGKSPSGRSSSAMRTLDVLPQTRRARTYLRMMRVLNGEPTAFMMPALITIR